MTLKICSGTDRCPHKQGCAVGIPHEHINGVCRDEKNANPCFDEEKVWCKDVPATDTQQLKAKIAALASEIERRTRDEVSISPSMVVERLRQLSAV